MRDAGHRTPDTGRRTPDIGHRTAKKAKIIYPPPRGVDIITLILLNIYKPQIITNPVANVEKNNISRVREGVKNKGDTKKEQKLRWISFRVREVPLKNRVQRTT